MAEDLIFKHLSAGTKLTQTEDDGDGRHLSSGAGTNDFALFDASDRIINKLPLTALSILLKAGNLLHIPTNAGWTEVVTGSGSSSQIPSYCAVYTGATNSSTALLHTVMRGFRSADLTANRIDWDKKLYFLFKIARFTAAATAVARIQIKEANTIGQLAAKGIELKIANLAMHLESYGTELGTVDLSTAMTSQYPYKVLIAHDPTVPEIKCYVEGALVGTQSTAAKIPSGDAGADSRIMVSLLKGAVATQCILYLYHPKLLQEA